MPRHRLHGRALGGSRRRVPVAVLACMLVQGGAGCATIRGTAAGWSEDERGLSRDQQVLRAALTTGDFPAALATREDDALLRVLTTGTAAYYSAQFARTARLLDSAAMLADARRTTSLSRTSLALVTNDLARAYEPRRTELLFIPYYAMLSYAQLGQWEDAAVEARRLSALLARDGDDRDGSGRELHATMHYLAGAVFERAGERQSAAVSFLNARTLSPAAGSRLPAAPAGSGDVLLIVERGFVAHRVTGTLHLALPASAFPGKADTGRHPVDGRADGRGDRRQVAVAIAVLRRSPPMAGTVRVRSIGEAPYAVTALVRTSADVDESSAEDERREHAAVVAREMVRATGRIAIAKAARDRHGEAAGRLADLGAAFFARADVRSWHVLPREVVLVRVRVPAGPHTFLVDEEDLAHPASLSAVADVPAGTVTILPVRLWRGATSRAGQERVRGAGIG